MHVDVAIPSTIGNSFLASTKLPRNLVFYMLDVTFILALLALLSFVAIKTYRNYAKSRRRHRTATDGHRISTFARDGDVFGPERLKNRDEGPRLAGDRPVRRNSRIYFMSHHVAANSQHDKDYGDDQSLDQVAHFQMASITSIGRKTQPQPRAPSQLLDNLLGQNGL